MQKYERGTCIFKYDFYKRGFFFHKNRNSKKTHIFFQINWLNRTTIPKKSKYYNNTPSYLINTNVISKFVAVETPDPTTNRATDKARKSVITHWKWLKTHWKNKQGVKIRINTSCYALDVQSSAYWSSMLKWKENSGFMMSICLSVCQHIANDFLCIMIIVIMQTSACKIIPSSRKLLPKLY